MNRRNFINAALSGVVGASGAERSEPPAERPNVIVFFTDQQRWDSIGAYGSPMGLTPNLDALAASGVRFENAFTPNPVCAPARAALQTGKYPTTTGVVANGQHLKDDETTMAHHFKRHGYQVGYIGKWHLGSTRTEPVPLERRGGYDQWWTASDVLELTSLPYEGTLWDRDNRPIKYSQKYRTDAVTDLAVDFLRQRKPGPFYLMVSYIEPHHQNSMDTFVAPNGYARRYRNNFHIPQDLAPYPGDWRSQLPEYYGIVARLDECLGRLLGELKAQGLDKNTIVVYSSDHGCHFRTRGIAYKQTCHESSIHVPMIIDGPGFNKALAVPELVSLIDLAPTLLDAAGIEPQNMQGKSMLPLTRREAQGWRNDVLIQVLESRVMRALRTDRWVYCVCNPEREHRNPEGPEYQEYQFYDLLADPHQHVNLIGRPDLKLLGTEHRKVADELAERLIARMVEAGEPRARITPARFYA